MLLNLSNNLTTFSNPTKKILVADDEEDIRNIFQEFLKDSFEIKMAKNGKEAVAIANEWKPDLILMDIKMPEMSGIEASRIILSNFYLPIIAITAFQGTIQRQIEELGLHYIRKPFRLKTILEKINCLISNDR
ncbi:MAG: response regulator [Candidatus Heimdallarchaeum endolithica]|uniref:Response regulator n=1 Tax=Candidatus Heimdallarchaeum endolithica TaxID=2876572 RepID=A0A9Y1BTB6_9ARCH|nr:MAG: response regulator [Candidatus Heimdallarchaeum endolithica]